MKGPGLTGVILGAELRALRNRLLRSGPVRLVLLALLLLAAVVFVGGGAFAVGGAAGHFLPAADDSLLAGGFTALSALMLVIGFPTVIATFFVGRNLLQLVVAPVPTRQIFAARLVLAMSANVLVSAILMAGVLGLGVGTGASWLFFPLAVGLILIQVVVVTSLQAILMTVVLRWVPARLARDVAAAVAGITGASFYLAWNLNLRHTFSGSARPDVSNVVALVQRVDWIPSAWPGHALSAAVAGRPVPAAAWALLTIVLAALLVAVAELLYERTLLAGLGIFGSTPVVWRRKAPPAALTRSDVGLGSPVLAIARKDWLGFRRDIRRLSRLLPAVLFPIGYGVALSQPSRNVNGFWTNVLLVAFMSMFMSSSLASPSIPSERRGFLLLRMAPLTMTLVLRAKVLLTLPPVIAMTFLFSVVVAIVSRSNPAQVVELVVLVLWLAVGFVSIGVSAGGIDPRFEATDDRRSIGFIGTVTSIGGSLGFGLLSIGAFAGFVFGAQGFAGGARLGPIQLTPTTGALMWTAGVLMTIGAAAVVALLLWFANTRLRSFEASVPTSD